MPAVGEGRGNRGVRFVPATNLQEIALIQSDSRITVGINKRQKESICFEQRVFDDRKEQRQGIWENRDRV